MIDQDRVRALEEDFGADDFAEIVLAFLDEATEAVTAMSALEGKAEREEILRHLHFLKGCARNVGAMGLGDLCEELEARPEDAVNPEVVRQLRAHLDAVHDWYQCRRAA